MTSRTRRSRPRCSTRHCPTPHSPLCNAEKDGDLSETVRLGVAEKMYQMLNAGRPEEAADQFGDDTQAQKQGQRLEVNQSLLAE